MHVRPLRRPRAPGNPRNDPRTQHQSQGGLFLASDHRPPLAGLKLVRPRPRLTARRCGRSSLTPARATAQTGSSEEKPQQQSHPNPGGRRPGHRVTGSIQHGPLIAGVPMGADMTQCPVTGRATRLVNVLVRALGLISMIFFGGSRLSAVRTSRWAWTVRWSGGRSRHGRCR